MNIRTDNFRAATGRPAIAVLAALAAILAIDAPANATDDDPAVWLIASTADALSDDGTRWRYSVDAQARYFDPGSGVAQYLIRPAIGYELENGTTLWAGYARFRSRTQSGDYFDEDRFWQQVGWKARPLGDGALSFRVRLEERSVSRGDDLGITLRVMGRYVQPIGTSGRTEFVFALEPFYDLVDTDWGGSSRLSQNRTFFGIGQRLNESVRLETGYMNQFIWVDSGEDRSNHVLVLNFRLSF